MEGGVGLPTVNKKVSYGISQKQFPQDSPMERNRNRMSLLGYMS